MEFKSKDDPSQYLTVMEDSVRLSSNLSQGIGY